MSVLNKVTTIAYYTMKEILKSKILLNVSLIGLGMMLISYVASEFTYGVPQRVALDFGVGMLWFSSAGISLFIGSTLVSRELESRTVYMIISRPVPRYAFILGKVLGLMQVLLLNIIILSLMTLTVFVFLGGQIDQLIYWALIFNVIESLLLLLVVVFFSLLTNNILSVLIALVLLFAGHFVKETQNIFMVKNNVLVSGLLDFYHYVLPGFYKLNLKDFLLYQQTLPAEYLWTNLGYGIVYSLFLLFLILFLFEKKNLD